MQRKPLIAAFIAAAIAFPLAATAASTDKTSGAKSASAGTFKSLDRNGDGFISKDEAMGSPHQADFDQLDKNRDGKLSKAEHAAFVGTGQSASNQPGTATPPGTSPTMPNSPPPAGNTQGTGTKVQ